MHIHPTARIDPTVRMYGRTDLLTVGALSRIDAYTVLTIGPGGMHIGERVHIGTGCLLAGGGGCVRIENYSGISHGTKLYTESDDFTVPSLFGSGMPQEQRKTRKGDVTLEPYSAALTNSVILPGVTLRRGAILCALSIASEDVPAYQVVSSTSRPRVVRTRDAEAIEALGAAVPAQPPIVANVRPILYVVTALWRHDHLAAIAESLRQLEDYFWVRWFPIQHCPLGDSNGASKRNTALDMIDRLDEGWIYYLDDDNLIHPSFGKSLREGIEAHKDAKVFFMRSVRRDDTWFMPNPTLVPEHIDTGCFVAHTSAAQGVRWDLEDKHVPDYIWIRTICERGHVPVLLEGKAYYNAASAKDPDL